MFFLPFSWRYLDALSTNAIAATAAGGGGGTFGAGRRRPRRTRRRGRREPTRVLVHVIMIKVADDRCQHRVGHSHLQKWASTLPVVVFVAFRGHTSQSRRGGRDKLGLGELSPLRRCGREGQRRHRLQRRWFRCAVGSERSRTASAGAAVATSVEGWSVLFLLEQ